MNHTERRILLITCVGHFLSHYNMLVFSALVLPLAGLLHLDMASVLGLSFWMYLLFGLTALPWGLIGDRWSGKSLMLIMFAGCGMSALAAAYSINSPMKLSLALAGVGLFSGIYHPIGMGLISKGVNRVSLAMGYNAAFGGLGLVAPPLATGMLNWLSGPAAAFVFVGALNLAGLVLMALLPLAEPAAVKESTGEEENGMLGAFLILLVAMMVAGVAYTGSTLLLPTYIELKSPGIIEAVSGWWGGSLSGNLVATTITALIYIVGMTGQYIGGHVGERWDQRYSYLAFHLVCIPAAFLMAYAQNLPLMGLAAIYFFCMLGNQPIENTLVAYLTPRRLHHSAFGLKFVLTFGVGALAVKMIQWIDRQWGIEATFVALGITSVVLVTSIVCLILQTNRSAVKRTGVLVEF